jgi:hypothetical protein
MLVLPGAFKQAHAFKPKLGFNIFNIPRIELLADLSNLNGFE